MSQNYILFYSRSCEKSFEILDILRQNEEASRQILKANMEDPNIQIPPFIRNLKSPILLIHTSSSQRPEIHQGQDCFQAILHLINKISFFPKHQQKNSQSVMPPQPTGSIPRQNNLNQSPPVQNQNQRGSIPPPNPQLNQTLNMEALGSLGMYESSNQISNMYTLINDSNFVENHESQYSYIENPVAKNSGGSQQQQQHKSQFDNDYEKMMQQRSMGMPRPIERK
jgi:hypothetical protein